MSGINPFISCSIFYHLCLLIEGLRNNSTTLPPTASSSIYLFTNTTSHPANPPVYLKNIDCSVHEDVVATDAPTFRFLPYFVKLHRCQGANRNPDIMACKAKSTKNVKISALSLNRHKWETLTIANHTECEFTCKRNASSCTKYGTWNPTRCTCECPRINDVCGPDSHWDHFFCSCVCSQKSVFKCQELGKEVDSETCECIPKDRSETPYCNDSIRIKYVVVIMFVELFIVVIICGLIFYRFFYTAKHEEDAEEVRLKKTSTNGESA